MKISLVVLVLTFCAATYGRVRRQANANSILPNASLNSFLVGDNTPCPSQTSLCEANGCICDSTSISNFSGDRCVTLGCCRPLAVTTPSCPNNGNPLMAVINGQQVAVGCCPFSKCQNGYFCGFDQVNQHWTCCSTGSGGSPVTQAPVGFCSNGAQSLGSCYAATGCPFGTSCEQTSQQCCVPSQVTTPSATPLDREFTALINNAIQAAAAGQAAFGCQQGTAELYQPMLPNTRLPLICDKGAGTLGNCPRGSTCVPATGTFAGQKICCRP